MNLQEIDEINKRNIKSSNQFYDLMNKRRTIRRFTSQEVSLEVINQCIKTAGTAPSGANKQPWYFAVIKNSLIKKQIKDAAEKEEFEFYNGKNNDQWLKDLKCLDTNWQKPHLKEASALIVIFSKSHEDEKKSKKCYYSKESVGIATGILITALHQLGISTLTHTPNPMNFLNILLKRPSNEKPFLILAVGYRDYKYKLPDLKRKSLDEICKIY